jgi:hypothetical protein
MKMKKIMGVDQMILIAYTGPTRAHIDFRSMLVSRKHDALYKSKMLPLTAPCLQLRLSTNQIAPIREHALGKVLLPDTSQPPHSH